MKSRVITIIMWKSRWLRAHLSVLQSEFSPVRCSVNKTKSYPVWVVFFNSSPLVFIDFRFFRKYMYYVEIWYIIINNHVIKRKMYCWKKCILEWNISRGCNKCVYLRKWRCTNKKNDTSSYQKIKFEKWWRRRDWKAKKKKKHFESSIGFNLRLTK